MKPDYRGQMLPTLVFMATAVAFLWLFLGVTP
jgi:hypothetical protein